MPHKSCPDCENKGAPIEIGCPTCGLELWPDGTTNNGLEDWEKAQAKQRLVAPSAVIVVAKAMDRYYREQIANGDFEFPTCFDCNDAGCTVCDTSCYLTDEIAAVRKELS